MDIYEPEGDANTMRPLIIMGHGGFFIGGENDNPDVLALCQDLTKMGYVVGSITYRLGVDNFLDVSNALGPVRVAGIPRRESCSALFQKNGAEDGNPWGIDPDRIYFAGVSAGGFIGLHMAYVDDESEIPPQVDQSQPGMGGGWKASRVTPDTAARLQASLTLRVR